MKRAAIGAGLAAVAATGVAAGLLATSEPAGPGNLKACWLYTARWNPEPAAVLFRVYRDGSFLTSTRGTTAKNIRICGKGRTHSIGVTSVDVAGVESAPSKIIVPGPPLP